jgi:hypothetical protein
MQRGDLSFLELPAEPGYIGPDLVLPRVSTAGRDPAQGLPGTAIEEIDQLVDRVYAGIR